MSDKVLINCSFKAGDAEGPTIAFIVANTAAAADNETVVFLTSDSVNFALKGGADGVQTEGHEPLAQYIETLIENGGKLWVCPACATPRGIKPEDLIDGAEWQGAMPMIEFGKQASLVL